ncbi:KdpD-like non-kinase potassium sensor [Ectobacillus sp. JY-23]|nr:KdpD-like non-kinase potassium sensor [Ectobacillus sp. JY-23]
MIMHGEIFRRRTPEEYLEELARQQRGKLKVYIGAAPGVGKTYKMLQDAQDLKKEGIDVVVGLVETHGRTDTDAQLGELVVFPMKEITYKGKIFYEVDTEGIIKRAPQVVLIDELAHTNAPGSKHHKRYMDVEEILEAGIDVCSAMNIQHLESVHDIVQQITGVAVRERVPDSVLQKANEIQLIDVTPEMLQKRLVEGKIYRQEKIQQSLQNFFTITNLGALRELALREVADDVDEKIVSPQEDETWSIGIKERILVCVQYGSTAERLIRRGARMASRLNADLYVLNVRADSGDFNSPARNQILAEWESLTHQFGAEFIVEPASGRKPADVIIDVASTYKITQVLLGQSARTRWEEITKGSIVNVIMRKTKNIDIHIVADSGK